eukprot:6268348-Amphidinium_carterae.1
MSVQPHSTDMSLSGRVQDAANYVEGRIPEPIAHGVEDVAGWVAAVRQLLAGPVAAYQARDCLRSAAGWFFRPRTVGNREEEEELKNLKEAVKKCEEELAARQLEKEKEREEERTSTTNVTMLQVSINCNIS